MPQAEIDATGNCCGVTFSFHHPTTPICDICHVYSGLPILFLSSTSTGSRIQMIGATGDGKTCANVLYLKYV